MNKIGIIGAGTGTLPTEVLRMAKEANVEIVELDKDYSPNVLQFLFRLRFWLKPHVGVRSRKKGKINIRGVLIELLGFHV